MKSCVELFQEIMQREEEEAESINKPSGVFCWKDEKWKILKENKGGKVFCLFKDKEILTHSSDISRRPTLCQVQ